MRRAIVVLGLFALAVPAFAQPHRGGLRVLPPSWTEAGIMGAIIVGLLALETLIFRRALKLGLARAAITALASDAVALSGGYAAFPAIRAAGQSHWPGAWTLAMFGTAVLLIGLKLAIAVAANPRCADRRRLLTVAFLTLYVTAALGGAVVLLAFALYPMD